MKILIDGKKISNQIKEEIKKEVQDLKISVCLAVIIVGEDSASQVYVKNKIKACNEIGFKNLEYKLPEKTTEQELLNLVNKLNNDDTVDAILVQLPLPKHISENVVIDNIDVNKDADCFNNFNVGKLYNQKRYQANLDVVPCTPAGVIELLDRYSIQVSGKNVLVIGRSNIVGKPLSIMLLNRDATVTICHSKTANLKQLTREADILIAAVGIPKFVKEDMVKPEAIVIDVGINRDENNKLCGDVDFESVKDKVSAITPVPGGVGPMTIAMLMKNALKLAKNKIGKTA